MKKTIRILTPIIVLAVGAVAAVGLFKSKSRPTQESPAANPPRVLVVEPNAQAEAVDVEAMGEVIPARLVELFPEVSGRVRWVSPRLALGGHVRKGELLVRIDPADYLLAVDRAEAAVVLAERDLALERGRGRAALEEWRLASVRGATDDGRQLAQRQPQLRGAEANLKSAKSALRQARLQLKRTRLRSPFEAYVRSEAVETGMQVSPQSRLATLVGSEVVWIQAAVPVEQLQWIDIPGINAQTGSTAEITPSAGVDTAMKRAGRVVRVVRELDPKGRMAQLIIAVDHPFTTTEEDELPLFVGDFVRIAVSGRPAPDLLAVPNEALRQGNRVWIVAQDCTLSSTEVQVVRRQARQVLVRAVGLSSANRVVVSPLIDPVNGLAVQVLHEGKPDGDHPLCDAKSTLADLGSAAGDA